MSYLQKIKLNEFIACGAVDWSKFAFILHMFLQGMPCDRNNTAFIWAKGIDKLTRVKMNLES